MFKEAQQRIIDLNQSRLYALEELAEARAKIIDLEERLSTAEKDALGMTLQVAKEAAEIKKSRELPGTESEDAGTTRGAEEAEAAADNLEHDYDDFEDDVKSVGEAATGVISILYETAWEPAFIHFNCPEHSSWTDSPGMKMKTGELPNHKIFSITASSLEFVLNDGEYEWDKPSYDSNYFIGSPGSYILKVRRCRFLRRLRISRASPLDARAPAICPALPLTSSFASTSPERQTGEGSLIFLLPGRPAWREFRSLGAELGWASRGVPRSAI